MRLSLPCVAAAALIGSSLLAGGCTRHPLPASPVPAPLSDLQAMRMADDYLDRQKPAGERLIMSAEPTGDGHLVHFHTAFDDDARPPVQSRLVVVKHTGAVREMTFRRGE